MKTALLCLGTMVAAVCLSSCSDGLLEVDPTSNFTEDIFWETEDDAVAAVNAAYAVTRGHVGRLWESVITPNSYSDTDLTQLQRGAHDPGNENIFIERWNDNYEGIGRTNNLLGNIDQIEMEERLKERVKGEARFLRAFFYSELASLYGGVPLILDPPDASEQGDLPRDSKEDVIAQVLSDLNFAIEVLPLRSAYTGGDIGRATKGAALALKARVLLYQGRWEEAAAAAQEVMQLGEYSLFPDYRELFMPANENNQEIIFDAQFVDPEYTHVVDRWLELQYDIVPLPDLVNSYLMIDGQTIQESPLYNPENPYQNRDPRLMQTIVIEGTMFRGQVVPEGKQFNTGYGYKKNTTYADDVEASVNENSGLNFIILRYADVLLMYAEAQNEASGPDASVYEALNLIRDRAGMPELPAGLSQAEMRETIRHERRIELAGEGLYYNDIRRWRTAEVVMNTDIFDKNGDFLQSRSFDPSRDYLWPIAEETMQDNPALEQNPGY